MIIAFVILGVLLLILARFVPAPGAGIATGFGACFLAIGLILLVFYMLGYSMATW